MTFGEVRDQARRYARVNSTGASDSQVFTLINDAMEQFAIDVHGLPQDAHLTLTAKFDLDTTMGFHLEVTGSSNNDCDTDVAVTDSDANEQTGAQTATELQSQIRAAIGGSSDLTVSWSKFAFTVDAQDASTIAITGPSDTTTYFNAVPLLFGTTQSGTSSVTGGFPEDCTIEADLPSGAMKVEQVWWEYYPLMDKPRIWFIQPQIGGDAQYFHERGNRIRIFPVPEEQKRFYVEYKGTPSRVGSPSSSSEVDSSIPSRYHQALAYLVASKLLDENFEDELSSRRYVQYHEFVREYRTSYANKNTSTDHQVPRPLWYDVKTT